MRAGPGHASTKKTEFVKALLKWESISGRVWSAVKYFGPDLYSLNDLSSQKRHFARNHLEKPYNAVLFPPLPLLPGLVPSRDQYALWVQPLRTLKRNETHDDDDDETTPLPPPATCRAAAPLDRRRDIRRREVSPLFVAALYVAVRRLWSV